MNQKLLGQQNYLLCGKEKCSRETACKCYFSDHRIRWTHLEIFVRQTYFDWYLFCLALCSFSLLKTSFIFHRSTNTSKTTKQLLTFQKHFFLCISNVPCSEELRSVFRPGLLSDPHMYDSHCTQYCCSCKECKTESKTKEAEFKQSIKILAFQLFFIDLRSLSHTRSIFGPWHIEKDGVWILIRATEVVLGAMNRHIFSLKGFEMKLIKSYTTQTVDSRGMYLQSHPAQIHIRSLSSTGVFSANWNLLLRERHLGSCEKYFQWSLPHPGSIFCLLLWLKVMECPINGANALLLS